MATRNFIHLPRKNSNGPIGLVTRRVFVFDRRRPTYMIGSEQS